MNNSSIYYESHGDNQNPCIILIPGIEGQITFWPIVFTDSLMDKNFYVVTLDNRDAGLSTRYDHLDTPKLTDIIMAKKQGKSVLPPYTLQDMANDVIALMDFLKIRKAHVTGISMGGIIAQYVAINHSDRILSLTCIASTSGDAKLPSAKKEVLDFFATTFTRDYECFEDYITNKLALLKIYNHPEQFNELLLRENIIQSFNRCHYPQGFQRAFMAMICATARTEELKQLTIPTLIIHGDYDPVFTIEHGLHLAEVIPNAKLEIIKNLGHGLPECVCKNIVNLCCDFYNTTVN